jgi:hypothetical protein
MKNEKETKPVLVDEKPAEPVTPTLTPEQKIQVLTLQRAYLLAQSQKQAADQQADKATQELNRTYQELISQHEGFTLNDSDLTFVPIQKQ